MVIDSQAMLLGGDRIGPDELWALSGAWLAFSVALMAAGVLGRRRGFRLAALGVAALSTAKVFPIDTADLQGIWRVMSFLLLGLVLIGMGAVHARFGAERPEDRPGSG